MLAEQLVYTIDVSWWVWGLAAAWLVGKAVAWMDAAARRGGWSRSNR